MEDIIESLICSFNIWWNSPVNSSGSDAFCFGRHQNWFSFFNRHEEVNWKLLSRVWLLATPWTAAHQVPLSMVFSRQEYCSGLPCPPSGDLPNPGIEPRSLASQAGSLPSESSGNPKNTEMGSLSLLQGSFLTQKLNLSLLHYRRILYQLSYIHNVVPPLQVISEYFYHALSSKKPSLVISHLLFPSTPPTLGHHESFCLYGIAYSW